MKDVTIVKNKRNKTAPRSFVERHRRFSWWPRNRIRYLCIYLFNIFIIFFSFFFLPGGIDRFTDHHQRFAQSHASIIGGHNTDCLLFERPGLIRYPSLHGGIAEQVRSNVASGPIQ